MSEQSNIQTVQTIFEAFGRGDVPTILGYVADQVDWKATGPESILDYYAPRSTPAEVGQFFVDLTNTLEYSAFLPTEFYGSGDKVFVLGEYSFRVRANDAAGRGSWAMVFTLKDGKIIHWRAFEDPTIVAAALSA
ncbi:MAG: nuclear transport factor 2 family protein [Anaerolineae bacterium]|nr:nuclear transport factor 2 family protein [Anaerolineae bacterium]